jgi:hypothetical protein
MACFKGVYYDTASVFLHSRIFCASQFLQEIHFTINKIFYSFSEKVLSLRKTVFSESLRVKNNTLYLRCTLLFSSEKCDKRCTLNSKQYNILQKRFGFLMNLPSMPLTFTEGHVQVSAGNVFLQLTDMCHL